MKSINDIINEVLVIKHANKNTKTEEDKVIATPGGKAKVIADITTLSLIAEMCLDWLKNPNKKADFYKGDGGQFVSYETENIKNLCEDIISKSDDMQNDY